ncbi:gliding motility-associated C-terminal domain-containing protein [Flavobacterium sp. GT3R68]|uniref:T9SS type B sorting domain-containing protein n=1 Tax=Flavobacterium sp. GT3R68 TaxID=2594437 RepID=UPI0013154310|nr:gliding motility-associated C-terminal domain-containing protein [Flavobacterium sp. GT3R68]
MKNNTYSLQKLNITQILLFLTLMFYTTVSFSQFTADQPDLRLCGSAPNYYVDYYNCSANNYTLNQVFLSLTNVNGVPLTNTTCVPGTTQPMYIMLNYTSNSNSNVENARVFADIYIKHNNVPTTTPINVNLGTITPGSGQRLIYGPFNWVCGDELSLNRILVVYRTSGTMQEWTPYDCSTYSKSQCDKPVSTLIASPLAVQFEYTQCTVGNQTTVTFNEFSNGGILPYISYLWNFGDGTTSNVADPVHVYPSSGGPYTVTLTVTDSNLPTHLVGTQTQTVTINPALALSASITALGCNASNNGAIDLFVSGGTSGYTYSWTNGATTQDISGLAAGSYTVTVTDSVGCIKTATYVVAGGDASPPTASNPAPITLTGCNGTFPSPDILVVTDEADNVGTPVVTYVGDSAPSIVGCIETIIRTYKVTDACNNSINVTQNLIRTVDTTPPTASNPAAIILTGCNASFPAADISVVTNEADNCGTPIVAFVNDSAPVLVGCTETTIRTFSVTDACNNKINVTQNLIRTVDTTPPTASNPAAITLTGCNGSFPAADISVVTNEADNCGAPVVAFVNDSAPALVGCTETTIRSYSVTDACNNKITVTQNLIRTVDTTPPTASNPAAITLTGCNGSFPAADISVVTDEADNCGTPVVAFVNDSTPVLVGCNETTIRSFSVTDACNNKITVTQNLIRTLDTTPPTASNPATFTLTGCNGSFPAADISVVTNEADNCGIPIVAFVNDSAPVLVGCTETTIRTYSVTDACNNIINVTQNLIRTVDTTPPTASNPASMTLTGCNGSFPAADISVVTNETDNCGTPIVAFVSDSAAVLVGCTETTIRTYSVTDACNNKINVTQNLIRTVDTTSPTASNPAAITLTGCNGNFPAPNVSVVTNEADNCGTPLVAFVSESGPNLVGCTETIIRTYSVTDACGNSIPVTQNLIRTVDTASPTASNPAAITLTGCNGTFPAPNVSVVTDEADNCSAPIVTFVNDSAPNLVGCTETTVRTYRVTDACNNKVDVTQNLVRTVDTTYPTATNPAAITLTGCNGSFPAPNVAVVTNEADNCSTPVVVFVSDSAPVLIGCTETTIRTYSVTDACNNKINVTQNLIRTVDTTAPVIVTAANNITVQCDGQGNQGAIANWLASNGGSVATDLCGAVTWTNNYSSISNDCSAAITVIFKATDACGNFSTTSATFSVNDLMAPTIVTPANNLTVQCDGQGNAQAFQAWLASQGGATASDDCSVISWTNNYSTLTNTCGLSGSASVIFTATDACGNNSSSTGVFTIQDTTPPVFTIPANITLYSDAACSYDASVAVTGDVINESDTCSNGLQATYVDTVVPGQCLGSYTITRTWSLVDSCGNAAANQTQTITVLDNILPTFTAPANITVSTDANCNYDASVAMVGDVTNEGDNCSTGLQATYVDAIVPGQCSGSFIITRTWSLVDSCGNAAPNQVQTITIIDNMVPTFSAPADLTINTDANCAYDIAVANTGDVINEVDNCSTGLQATYVDAIAPGSCQGSQVITRTWSLIDNCGNPALNQVQTITILDNLAPTFKAPAEITIITAENCNYDASVAATGDVIDEADNCSSGIQATYVDVITQSGCQGFDITRTWSLIDNCGNAAPDQVQTIHVMDNSLPTFAIPQNMTVYTDATCNYDASIAITGDVTDELDNCSPGIQATYNDTIVAGECMGSYTITRTWSLVDNCGNAAPDQIQTITVMDNIAPTFTVPADMTVYTDATCNYNIGVDVTGDVLNEVDNCSVDIQASYVDSITPGQCEGSFTVTRVWTLADSCGNSAANQTQTITVMDNLAPVYGTPLESEITVQCNNIPPIPDLVFTDNCSSIVIVDGPISPETPIDVTAEGYVIIRTWTATDNCGNITTVTQKINVEIQDSLIEIPQQACNGDSATIDLDNFIPAEYAGLGIWVDNNSSGGLHGDNDGIFSPFGIPIGSYILEYQIDMEDSACPRKIQVNMSINEDCIVLDCGNIKVHNAFSPNNDGLNEWFQIDNIEDVICWPTNRVEIYNRWGVLVYEVDGYDNNTKAFRGISEGRSTVSQAEELPTGTYFYVLLYTTTEGTTIKESKYLYLSR